MSSTIRFDQLPESIRRHYGDGSTIHEILAWDDGRGSRFKVIRCDGIFNAWAYSRTVGWYITL